VPANPRDHGPASTAGDTPGRAATARTATRRRVLRSAAAGVVLASGVWDGGSDPGDEFPPVDRTDYGPAVTVGAGEVRPFTTSGGPTYHGVEFDREVLTGSLPDAGSLAADRTSGDPTYDDKYGPSGRALVVHRRESLQFFVPFPDTSETPVTFLGLNWNPEGHPGARGAWARPHFDVHFHMLGTDTVDAIEGPAPAPYDGIADEKIPAGYSRSPPPMAAERYITDMGEHLAPADAPEVPGTPEAFENTLIQGFVAVEGRPRLAFVEPMLTREFLQEFTGRERQSVPQPSVYPHDSTHPTAYEIRGDEEMVTVLLRSFEPV